MPDPRPAYLFHPDGSFLAQHARQRPTLTLEMWEDAAKAAREAWGLEVWTLHNGESSPLHLQAVTDGLPQGWAGVREDAPPLPGARRWQRPGWRAEVLGWLAERGVTVQTVRPISTYDLNTILEVQTGEKTLFLKVSESPREAAVTAYLARTLPVVTEASGDQPWCDAAAAVHTALRSEFDEALVTRRADGTQLWGSDSMGTWTLTLSRADDTQCVIASGIGYQDGANPLAYFAKVGLS